MDLDVIRELIQLMKEHQIAELDWQREGNHIRLKSAAVAGPPAPLPAAQPLALPPATQAEGAPDAGTAGEAPREEGIVITSPIVGMFYRSPSPEKPPFVEIGDAVDENTVLCIIEAMKVMNEIKAEAVGTVQRILVENGQPVEYGQPLFVLTPPGA
ncbi:MAG TPA: acetyl-CoA carboxylase biotin carboxyl carrier protein [Candidatus Sumerlaeota bacterium]|nr:MAG: Biotin carboxyl carrier protein of acetyl-CoA carboxylase [candidate division BRC1 bacterium ADurb.BinA292]HOE95186.1 acetyl-CoA carboxylase biotin carboxyl carrier protein [Candidatus Sumerlaeota bacterium]HOR27280.1 acetyl-CoA carboxylase biotin carboxyl carrier protein [Candidatus Sumerlaeota bacterium]HPK03661.1 acetyl-CoA carboxylase biotin carboxyl carrier protein [Candidatus Sumerlaeota bacterium]